MINEKMKQHAETAIKAGIRRDGRALDEFRPITIETGISSTAHGSAKITVGDSVIVAGVKIDVGTPYADTPDEGSLMVAAELLPMSNPEYESGPPSEGSIEVARVVDRSIRESKAIDLKKLSIKPGEKMWTVAIDVAPINANGNLIDLSCLVSLAAIRDARMPAFVDDKVDYEKLTNQKLPLQHQPILVTVFKLGSVFLVDPTAEEEQYCDARLSIATLEDGSICALQKGGTAAFTVEEVDQMVEIAQRVGAQLRAKVTQ